MSTFNIEFTTFCQTKFGEKVCICGNLPELGNWQPSKGLIMETNQHKYPIWNHPRSITIKEGFRIQFKLCIIDTQGQLIRWEQIHGNRCFSPKNQFKGSLMIEFSDSDASMIYKNLKNYTPPFIDVHNVRKGTDQVLNQLASDSSSNKQMWREHEFVDEEQDSLLLTQLTKELVRTVASQKQEGITLLQHQPKMQLHHLEFGSYNNHYYNTHYIFTPTILQTSSTESSELKIIFISYQSLDHFQLDHQQEVSIFHIVGCKKEDIASIIKDIMKKWMAISLKNIRGIINVYCDEFVQHDTITSIFNAGANNLITSNFQTANQALESFKLSQYKIQSLQKDLFIAKKQQQKFIKLMITYFTTDQFLSMKQAYIDEINPKLMNGYYFKFTNQRFQSRLNDRLSIWRMHKSQLLIILHISKLQQLQNKTILDLVHLSSLRFKVLVFVITQEKFNRNIQHKIPVAKNNVIFLNTFGDIYANSNQPIDIFCFIEINKNKFQQNQKIILQQLGIGIRTSYKKHSKHIIQFQKNNIGEIMKGKALKLIRDVNNKSIAKLIGQFDNQSLQLSPFCLHISFLYKVVIKTFSNRLKNNQKAMIINIDGANLKSLDYLSIPQGRQINIKFLPFGLNSLIQAKSAYISNPITQQQMAKMIEMISNEEYNSSNHNKTDILLDIKNLR